VAAPSYSCNEPSCNEPSCNEPSCTRKLEEGTCTPEGTAQPQPVQVEDLALMIASHMPSSFLNSPPLLLRCSCAAPAFAAFENSITTHRTLI
jgi:hypothetical protein